MPSDDTTVATQADFVPMAVGNTDRVRSVVSVSAHDGFSHHLRSGMQQGRLSVLTAHIISGARGGKDEAECSQQLYPEGSAVQ